MAKDLVLRESVLRRWVEQHGARRTDGGPRGSRSIQTAMTPRDWKLNGSAKLPARKTLKRLPDWRQPPWSIRSIAAGCRQRRADAGYLGAIFMWRRQALNRRLVDAGQVSIRIRRLHPSAAQRGAAARKYFSDRLGALLLFFLFLDESQRTIGRRVNPEILELFTGLKLSGQPTRLFPSASPSLGRLHGIPVLRNHVRVRAPRAACRFGGVNYSLAEPSQSLIKPSFFSGYLLCQH